MNIRQGEIWMVDFEPSIGSEIKKLRPAVVINDDAIGRFGLKVVVPITEWKDYYVDFPWIIKIFNNNENGLSKISSIECFQIKSFATERFDSRIGEVEEKQLFKIHEAVTKILNPRYKIN
jgi:mRNA interferase MazF